MLFDDSDDEFRWGCLRTPVSLQMSMMMHDDTGSWTRWSIV